MFSTGDLSVDIVMVTIKKQEGEDPGSVWLNVNILELPVTSRIIQALAKQASWVWMVLF